MIASGKILRMNGPFVGCTQSGVTFSANLY
jgi:hypothetical protein